MIIVIHKYNRCTYEYLYLFMKFKDFMSMSGVL
jgi:hypothetical protein